MPLQSQPFHGAPARVPRALRALWWHLPASALLLLVLALVAALAAPVTLPATTPVGSTYLCTGYASCRAAGYSDSGYQAASGTMYWRMYSGHNCTNYAAYRMVRSGMPNERPWEGGGNASNWGVEMASITDQTPIVGSIAWWKANVPGAGSSGHVAYVEQVVSATEIIVSEDSWGGDFHWRRITKSGTGWPSGFIHFNDKVVEAASPPKVVGTPTVGEPLSVEPGAWKPTATVAYRWLAGGTPIPGATTTTYTPTPEVRGKRLTVEVTATRKGYRPGEAVVTSAAVAPGTMTTVTPPAVEGVAEVDETLTLRPPELSPQPAATTVQWYADGVALDGATGPRLELAQEHIDKRITVTVTATAKGYRKAVVTSPGTDPVLAGTIEVASPFEVEGRPTYGATLTVRPGTVRPADATVAYTWLRDGQPVEGATAATYQLTAADVGRRISVQVRLTRRSYRSLTETVPVAGLVTTTPQLRVQPSGKPGRAAVRIRLSAPGVEAPSGPVTVRVGGRTVPAEVVDGRTWVVVDGVSKGLKRVVVRYAGTDVVRPGTWRGTVEVLPRR